jgi:hypothetical protein
VLLALPHLGTSQQPQALTPPNKFLVGAEIGIRIADTISTHTNLTDPCRCFVESDPLAPHSGSWGKEIAFQSLAAMAVIGGARFLAHKHHTHLANALLSADIADESLAVSHNIYLQTSKK